eukprot:CAMPEP_0176390086 /NCGR_PEP_ID=MMETSP0126-20121128/38889_1 /TAXON_ID=141414 ORGANISM="Strombidinopsis acuminatum, Strain SPMC142" /NCGR_SAMPLE_ID=MMETSP0126 /ASSEMBLY_ACC=CAM_ASM_000229 /LENGTH=58 /DNA_ID=CAMNT_0017759277 /DNA_START=130 /DNA_END=306 /DNA_ORIENTATION=-
MDGFAEVIMKHSDLEVSLPNDLDELDVEIERIIADGANFMPFVDDMVAYVATVPNKAN